MENSVQDFDLALENLARGQELIEQLRVVLMPMLNQPDIASSIFDKAIQSLTAAITSLPSSSLRADHQERVLLVSPEKKRRRSESDDKDNSSAGHSTRYVRRRLPADSWSTVTSTPHLDGYQWRKYGQKWIKGSNFQRSYYRCTSKEDQGCKAMKTVQQIDDDHEKPANFIVTYSMKHTCNAMDMSSSSPVVIDSSPRESSVTSTIHVNDQNQIAEFPSYSSPFSAHDQQDIIDVTILSEEAAHDPFLNDDTLWMRLALAEENISDTDIDGTSYTYELDAFDLFHIEVLHVRDSVSSRTRYICRYMIS